MTTASTRSGAIRVQTDELGLPLAVHIEPSEMRKDTTYLAGEVLRLCQQAARRADADRRLTLERAGVPVTFLDQAGLPSHRSIAEEETQAELEFEEQPRTWLRSV